LRKMLDSGYCCLWFWPIKSDLFILIRKAEINKQTRLLLLRAGWLMHIKQSNAIFLLLCCT
jgi:hypothetical protein